METFKIIIIFEKTKKNQGIRYVFWISYVNELVIRARVLFILLSHKPSSLLYEDLPIYNTVYYLYIPLSF